MLPERGEAAVVRHKVAGQAGRAGRAGAEHERLQARLAGAAGVGDAGPLVLVARPGRVPGARAAGVDHNTLVCSFNSHLKPMCQNPFSTVLRRPARPASCSPRCSAGWRGRSCPAGRGRAGRSSAGPRPGSRPSSQPATAAGRWWRWWWRWW